MPKSVIAVDTYHSTNSPLSYVDLVENQNIFKILTFFYLGSILILFFSFGGFNLISYSLMHLISAFFLCYLVFFESNHLSYILRKKNIRLILALLIFFCLYILAQNLVIFNTKEVHPVFGEVGSSYFNYGFYYFLKEPLFLLINFILFSALSESDYYNKILVLFIRTLGMLIALTALMHWFYDNGKLFWFFEPKYIFISSRARWPFVNSNHCGAILATIFTFQISVLLREYQVLVGMLSKNNLAKSYTEIFKPRNFNKLLKLFYQLVFAFIMVLAVLATESRASWAVVLFVVFLFSILIPPASKTRRKKEKIFSIKKIISNPLSSRFIKLCIVYFIGICSLLFFISGKGEDLILNRANYAINQSTSDLRFTFYSLSKQMLGENFLFGIGFKNWNEAFKELKTPELSNGNPVYLHSDPYQILVELGFIGVLPLILAIIYFSFTFVRLKRSKGSRRLIASFIAIIAIFCSSLVDFPFRSPAIMIYFMLICALFINEIERKTSEFI